MRYLYLHPRRNLSATQLYHRELALDLLGLLALVAALSPFLLLVRPCTG